MKSTKTVIMMVAGIIAITLTGGVKSVAAAPTIYGSTGLINTPTADVLRDGDLSFGYFHAKEGNGGSLNVNAFPKMEIGVARFRYDNGGHKTTWSGKFEIMPEQIITPGIAIGIEDIADRAESSVYGVISKTLPLGYRIHVGVGNGRFNGAFGSLEKTFKFVPGRQAIEYFPTTTFIAEYDGNHMNYGARIAIMPGLKLHTSWRNSEYFVGAVYTY